MFIYNFKINSKNLFKIFFIIALIIAILFFIISTIKIFKASQIFTTTNHELKTNKIIQITPENYTNILKKVHDNIDPYIGQKIEFTGYVYRVPDIKKEQFILARNMLINSDMQSVVVGFLCESPDTFELPDSSWIKITGEIQKYSYHNKEIPILKILTIESTDKPKDEYVYPPDTNFLETNKIL